LPLRVAAGEGSVEAFTRGLGRQLSQGRKRGRYRSEQLRRDLAERLAGVRASLQGLDGLAPSATVDGTGRALDWRLSRLERRISAAVKSRETSLMRDLATVRGSLFPGGVRQERALNLIPLLARHGVGLLDELRGSAAAHANSLLSTATESAVAS